MFGYIRPLKDELKIREYRLYRSYYCGFCKYLGKNWGPIPRLFLNHDLVFLSLLLASLKEEEETALTRCLLHPPSFHIIKDEAIFGLTAPINILLIYQKLQNDLEEKWSLRRFLAKGMLKGKYRELANKNEVLVILGEKELKILKEKEESGCDDLDEVSLPFARLLGQLFRLGDQRVANGRILEWMGFNLGKWIYLLDAYDDLKEDQEKGEYNPLLCSYKYQGGDLHLFQEKIKGDLQYLLHICLRQMWQGYQLLTIKKHQGLLENILTMGLYHTGEIVLGGGCKCGKGSVPDPWYQKGCL